MPADVKNSVYTFQLQIARDDQELLNIAIATEDGAEGAAKAKQSIQRLLNEYIPSVKRSVSVPVPQVEEAEPIPAVPPTPVGAKGMLKLHCKECENTFLTFLREPQSEVSCKCGCSIDLTAPLARFHFTCPTCGGKGYGSTNLETPGLTVKCRCGELVELDWSPKVREYIN